MSAALYDDLIESGLSKEEASRIAGKHEASVDTEVLFKTIEEIRGLRPGWEDLEEIDNTPVLTQEDMIKAIDNAEGHVERVQLGVDVIVDHVLSAINDRKEGQVLLAERQDILGKGLIDLSDGLKESLKQQARILDALGNLSGQPRLRKSRTGTAQIVQAPGDSDDVSSESYSSVLNLALGEMESLSKGTLSMGDNNRMTQLHQAVSALDSGAAPALVARKYRLSNSD